MDETLKTIRLIHFAFLTLCFTVTVFLSTMQEGDALYGRVRRSLDILSENRIWTFALASNEVLEKVAEKWGDKTRDELNIALSVANIVVDKEQIKGVNTPTKGVVSILSGTNKLIVLRRAVTEMIDEKAIIFDIVSATATASYPEGFSAGAECGAYITPPEETEAKLVIRYSKPGADACDATFVVMLKVHPNYIADTSLREWLVSKHLYSEPLFNPPGTSLLPDVDSDIWSVIQTKTVEEAAGYISEQEQSNSSKATLFGVDVSREVIGWVVPLLSFLTAVSILIHLYHASSRITGKNFAAVREFPWIGLFDNGCAQILYLASATLWPVLLGVWSAFLLRMTVANSVMSSVLWCLCAVVGVLNLRATYALKQRCSRLSEARKHLGTRASDLKAKE